MNSPQSNYVPGVCNINPAEIKQRRNAGHFGLIFFVILLAALVLLDANRLFRIALFVPAFVLAIGYLQAKNKFCVGYGGAGMQHADDDAAAVKVAADQAAKDKQRSRQINLQAAGVALALTGLSLLIP